MTTVIRMVNDVSNKKADNPQVEDVDWAREFYRNPPEWAKDGGPDGYWSDVVDWARMCHSDEDDEDDGGRSERSDL